MHMRFPYNQCMAHDDDRWHGTPKADADKKTEDWDPAKVLEAAVSEAQTLELELEEHGRKTFKEHLVPAALSICHLASHSDNEKVRLDAAKYVVERTLGRVPTATELHEFKNGAKSGKQADTFEEFLNGLQVDDTSAQARAAEVRANHPSTDSKTEES